MSKQETADLLVEIGTEELPPKALPALMGAFASGIEQLLAEERLAFESVNAYASPRRLAVIVQGLAKAQDDRNVEQKGPPISVAFDQDGKPSKAGLKFAEKCGVEMSALTREQTPKGEWLVYRATEAGGRAVDVLPGIVQSALEGLPVPRRMRWGAGSTEFVRPVHWVVMLHGDEPVPGEVLGITVGRNSRGHRFMGTGGTIAIDTPRDYLRVLEQDGFVVADFAARRARIVAMVTAAAKEAGGTAVGDAGLYDEVCALTEWPVAITGQFDPAFLELPQEVIVATLTGHQRYFPVAGSDDALLPVFITVANIDSVEPARVRDGNERVVQPRLADAAFFWENDRKTSLKDRQANLGNVIYQQGLGTLADKSRRIALLAANIAAQTGADPVLAERAGMLAKCDLLTGIVGEFPELQGVMGRYYALADKEPAPVAIALGEQYQPRFAGDELPASAVGQALAIADKLDTLCGIFASGKRPSGNRDPFGLRRAGLGIVRIVVEQDLELDMHALIESSLAAQPVQAGDEEAAAIRDFLVERLRGWYLERGDGSNEAFDAVRAQQVSSLSDFAARLAAVGSFVAHPAAESLAAANKRIANILKKSGKEAGVAIDNELFSETAERELATALADARAAVSKPLADRDYTAVLERLAELRGPVDRFFDDVMVMTDDDAARRNRLALLASLRAEFLNVADISRLSISRS